MPLLNRNGDDGNPDSIQVGSDEGANHQDGIVSTQYDGRGSNTCAGGFDQRAGGRRRAACAFPGENASSQCEPTLWVLGVDDCACVYIESAPKAQGFGQQRQATLHVPLGK